MQLNDRSARFFESTARLVIQAKYVVFTGLIMVAVVMALQLHSFTVDTSTEGLLQEEAAVRVAYDEFRKQFGRDELIIAAIGPANVFSAEFLTTLKAFHKDLEANVPHIDDLTSLINARNTRGEGDTLYVEDFLEGWPETGESMGDLTLRSRKNPVYRNTLINTTERYATVLIKTVAFKEGSPPEQALDGFSDE